MDMITLCGKLYTCIHISIKSINKQYLCVYFSINVFIHILVIQEKKTSTYGSKDCGKQITKEATVRDECQNNSKYTTVSGGVFGIYIWILLSEC